MEFFHDFKEKKKFSLLCKKLNSFKNDFSQIIGREISLLNTLLSQKAYDIAVSGSSKGSWVCIKNSGSDALVRLGHAVQPYTNIANKYFKDKNATTMQIELEQFEKEENNQTYRDICNDLLKIKSSMVPIVSDWFDDLRKKLDIEWKKSEVNIEEKQDAKEIENSITRYLLKLVIDGDKINQLYPALKGTGNKQHKSKYPLKEEEAWELCIKMGIVGGEPLEDEKNEKNKKK